MINWKFTNQHKDGFNYPKYISEDGRFIIIKEKKWFLYDENAPDIRWCRYSGKTLNDVQNEAERVLEEETKGRNPYITA